MILERVDSMCGYECTEMIVLVRENINGSNDSFHVLSLLPILPPIVMFFGFFITYKLALHSSKRKERNEVRLNRYENLYVPYINNLAFHFCHEIRPCDLTIRARYSFFELLVNNSHLLGVKSSALLSEYYNAFFDLVEKNFMIDTAEIKNFNINFQEIVEARRPDATLEGARNADEVFDAIFIKLTKQLLSEAEMLSKKLNYPNLSMSISNPNFLPNK